MKFLVGAALRRDGTTGLGSRRSILRRGYGGLSKADPTVHRFHRLRPVRLLFSRMALSSLTSSGRL